MSSTSSECQSHILVISSSSCAKGETGFCFELDSLVTLSRHIVLCGFVVVLFAVFG